MTIEEVIARIDHIERELNELRAMVRLFRSDLFEALDTPEDT